MSNFNVGDSVFVLKQTLRNRAHGFDTATIVEYQTDFDTYLIEFPDGKRYYVFEEDISPNKTRRTWAR